MRLGEFALIFGIFIMAFYSASSFLISFNLNNQVEKQEINVITQAWQASQQQLNSSANTVSAAIAKIQSGNILEQALGVLQAAFGTVFYVLLSLWNVFVSIPKAIFTATNYLLHVFGLDFIQPIIVAIITVIVIIKMIEFITGRPL
jgi:hypothetical protein